MYMGEVVYVLVGHNHLEDTDLYGVFYSVEQAEEHMKALIGTTDTYGLVYCYDEWIIIPQIVANPDEDAGDIVYYNSKGIRRNL